MAGEGEFVDGKDASALRTIGELCEALRLKAHVLRYWEDQFPMLKPLKRSGGRRYYRPEDVALVREIDRLVNRQGYTLRGARAALKDFAPGEAEPLEAPTIPVAGLQSALPAPPPAPGLSAETIGKLKAIRARLAGALAQ